MRVAAYHRFRHADIEQVSSVELLKRTYEDRINRCRSWKCVGCYFDYADSRTGFEKLMEEVEKGQIDRIVTRSAFDFIEDARDLIETAYRLKKLDPSVRIRFENEDITTGTAEWEHCVNFLMSFLESACKHSANNCQRLNPKEESLCRT